jgi:hypothetical protein
MNGRIRIGLIAEGEAEQGASIPYIKPEDGGKIIERNNEGALHTLIRRELENAGLPDCDFIQRHPLSTEVKRRVGHSILQTKYLKKVVSVWKPEEIDMIIIVVDGLDNTKDILENAIEKSTYFSEDTSNQRSLQIRWNLAFQIDLEIIKTCCPGGYAAFAKDLLLATQAVILITDIN